MHFQRVFSFAKAIRVVLLTVIATSLAVCLTAQQLKLPEVPIRQALAGNSGHDEVRCLAINPQGLAVVAGESRDGPNGGKDMFFAVFDNKLNAFFERRIGRSSDDGAFALTVLPDGQYLLAGYSEMPRKGKRGAQKYKGKKDGWLIQVDAKGNVCRELILGSSQDEAIHAMAISPNGGLFLAGNSGEAGWIIRLDDRDSILWEKKIQYHRQPTSIKTALLTKAGEWFVMGSTIESGLPKLWLAGYDAQGDMIIETTFPWKDATGGVSLVELDHNKLAIAGNVVDPDDRENGFICVIKKNCEVLHYELVGGRDFDELNNMIQMPNGDLLASGSSRSFERGSRRTSGWVVRLNKKGLFREQKYYGSRQDDGINQLVLHPDGRLLAAGFSNKNLLKSRQAWILQLTNPLPSLKRLPNCGWDKNPSLPILLTPGKVGSIPLNLLNKDSITLFDLKANITSDSPALLSRYFSFFSVQLPVTFPGKSTVHLPFNVAPNVPTGSYSIRVQLVHNGQSLGEPIELLLQMDSLPAPRLSFTAPGRFRLSKNNSSLEIKVTNSGSAQAEGLTLLIPNALSYGLKEKIFIGNLNPGQIWSTNLAISRHPFPATDLLRLRVVDTTLRYSATHSVQIEPEPEPEAIKPDTAQNYLMAVWLYPNPDHFDKKEIIWQNEILPVEIKILSNRQISKNNFCLEINGRPCPDGAKFDEVQIKGGGTHKTFKQQVSLVPGKNVLQVVVNTEFGKYTSETLTVIFHPTLANLHILSVGVPSADLKFTAKDAGDFANVFFKLKTVNQAFGHVFLDTLLSPESTTKTEMLKSLRRLQYRSNDAQINPADLLILFISSHGFNDASGNFRIAAGDYDSPFESETSLDFEKELLPYLAQIPCRKVIFLDACHSGAAFPNAPVGSGIQRISDGRSGVDMLLSCQPHEFSYEDEKWGNGAFTKTLIYALEGFCQPASVTDLNRDNQLDLQELFAFLQREVPKLVESKQPKPRSGQNPFLASGNQQPIILFKK